MNNRKAPNVGWVKHEDLVKYLQQHQELFNDKKIHELLIGCILVYFLAEGKQSTAKIGFPLTNASILREYESGLNLNQFLDEYSNLVDDRDTDIVVFDDEIPAKFQITRYYVHQGTKPHRTLGELIKHKCEHYTADNKVNLVVSIESTSHVKGDEFRQQLNGIKVPYGTILLLIKAPTKLGHFSVYQLYPKIVSGKEVMIPLPI